MRRSLYSLSVILFFTSCGPLITDPEPVYESAIRHYIENWSTLPDTLILSVEEEGPSETLLSRLDDLNIRLLDNETAKGLDFSDDESGTYRNLSVQNVRWRGPNRVLLEVVSSSTTPDGHTDAHGVEYLLQNKDGKWIVVEEGVEWMT
jgi:hypothetical protein